MKTEHDVKHRSNNFMGLQPFQINPFLNANFQSWSQQEDLNLLQLVKEKGYRVWAEIAKNFENRTRSQCRNRFHEIYKKFQIHPNTFDLSKMKYLPHDKMTLQGCRQKALYENLEKKVNLFLEQRTILAKTKIQRKRQKHNISGAKISKRNGARTNQNKNHGLSANVRPCRTHDETARRATKEGDSGLQDVCFKSF